MENIHVRLREEIDRLDLTMAEAARRMGESDSQELRDVCSGRKRASAALIAKIAASEIGADVLYILTGQRMSSAPTLKPDEAALLDNYRHCAPDGQACIAATSAAFAQRKGRRSA